MKKLLAGLALIGASLGASAAPVDYNISRTIGAGSVTGTIKTDGHTGALSTSDILDWTLLISDGTSSFTLFGPLAGNNSALLISGSGFLATALSLSYNYGAGGFALFQAPTLGSGREFWCQESGSCTGAGTGETIDVTSPFPGQHVARSGTVVFGTAATSVPEPGTFALLAAGVVLLVVRRSRSRGKLA